MSEDLERASSVADSLWQGLRDPASLLRVGQVVRELVDDAQFESGSPLESFGRARHLSGIALDARGRFGSTEPVAHPRQLAA